MLICRRFTLAELADDAESRVGRRLGTRMTSLHPGKYALSG